jgi:hypothetical protein
VAVPRRVGGAAGWTDDRLGGTYCRGRSVFEVEFLVLVVVFGVTGKSVYPTPTGGAKLLVDNGGTTVFTHITRHSGRYCATAVLFTEIPVFASIRQAEPWNPLSVIFALAMLAGISYLIWRAARRP